MREIKFRAWNGETMVSPDYIDRDGFAHWRENSVPTGTDKVMQYTGLKDKNGMKIYEGDIVRDCNGLDEVWVIEWSKEEACFLGLDWCGNPNEVIGNVYENPELKKGEK